MVRRGGFGDVNANGKVDISDALEILIFLAGMDGIIRNCNNAWNAALITLESQAENIPKITDTLEILMWLAGMNSDYLTPIWGRNQR
jgi:hypothetical protein